MAKSESVAGTERDPQRLFTRVELNGEEYKLIYTFGSLAEAEKLCGCNLLQGILKWNEMSAVQLRGLLYAALRTLQPKMTLEQVDSLLSHVDDVAAAMSALLDAYNVSMRKSTPVPTEGGSSPPATN
jgi:hypothetical protein